MTNDNLAETAQAGFPVGVLVGDTDIDGVFAADDLGKYNEPMTFALAGNGGNCSECTWISAIGVIGGETPQRLRDFVARNPYKLTIRFASPGGSLLAGLELGRIIREAKLDTDVGETFVAEPPLPWNAARPATCASACAYAFLGGVNRRLANGSKLGFHQFYRDHTLRQLGEASGLEHLGLSNDQVVDGILAAYLVRMSVDARLLTIASVSNRDQLTFPSTEVLTELGVITSVGWSPWHMQPMGDGLIAISNRLDTNGDERSIAFFCTPPERQAYVALYLDRHIGTTFETRYSREDFVKAISKATLAADGISYELSPEELQLWNEQRYYVLTLPLTTQAATGARKATSLNLATDACHAFFNFGPNATLTLSENDRKMIALALQNPL